jgi:hypothetical protein
MRITIPRPVLGAAVEGLAGVNCAILHVLDGRMPRLYESGVRYRQPGKLTWHTIADLYDLGFGDCKDLAAARCAELRFFEGEPAMPLVYETRRAHRWHAVVQRADGAIEDPSAILLALERKGA